MAWFLVVNLAALEAWLNSEPQNIKVWNPWNDD
jgi:hypothetical protein